MNHNIVTADCGLILSVIVVSDITVIREFIVLF